jgi:hypothetical protein
MNGSNLSDVKHGISKSFRNKKREYLKDKIDDFETNSKNILRDLYRGIVNVSRVT